MHLRLKSREAAVFGMLGGMMYASKLLMEALPNIHLICMFIIAFTLVYRIKALCPIYVFVMLEGIFGGFSVWWVPYLYIWLPPWALTMLLPKKMPRKILVPLCSVICALHGFSYGTLYAPFQAIAFGLNLKSTAAWIVSGLPFDAVHGISNLIFGLLAVPIAEAIGKIEKISP